MSREEQLRSHELEALDKEGFVVVPNVLPRDEVEQVETRLHELLEEHIQALRAVPPAELSFQDVQEQVVDFIFHQRRTIWPREDGVAHITLESDDPIFRPLADHPLIHEAAQNVLGPQAQSRGMKLIASMPGFGHQGLHMDFDEPKEPRKWERFEAGWVVSPLTPKTGTIRIIPGSHVTGAPEHDENDFGWAMPTHPDEVRIVADPGALLLQNRHVWYSRTFNGGTEPCLSVSVGFKRT